MNKLIQIPIREFKEKKPDSCEECRHYQKITDPYMTGDRWFFIYECVAGSCKWGY